MTTTPLSTACASTSTLPIPSCADRLEIEGEHARVGRALVFDHRFDPPWSTTKIVLQGRTGSRVVRVDNHVPDLPRLAAGCGVGAAGCGIGALGLLGGGPGVVVAGSVIAGGGAALALTGWHPDEDEGWDLEAWCAEEQGPAFSPSSPSRSPSPSSSSSAPSR